MLVLSYKQGFCSISASHFESGHHQTVNFQVGGAQIAKEETPLTTDMRFVWNSTFWSPTMIRTMGSSCQIPKQIILYTNCKQKPWSPSYDAHRFIFTVFECNSHIRVQSITSHSLQILRNQPFPYTLERDTHRYFPSQPNTFCHNLVAPKHAMTMPSAFTLLCFNLWEYVDAAHPICLCKLT